MTSNVVQTTYPGASPENVESDVTRKIEETVNTINGIRDRMMPILVALVSVAA